MREDTILNAINDIDSIRCIVEDIEDMIYQLGVLIADASQGILITTLKKIFLKNIKNLTQ